MGGGKAETRYGRLKKAKTFEGPKSVTVCGAESSWAYLATNTSHLGPFSVSQFIVEEMISFQSSATPLFMLL
jgi:hypothetical protein